MKIVVAGMIEPAEIEKYASYLRKLLGEGFDIYSVSSQTRMIQGFELKDIDIAVVANPPSGLLGRMPKLQLVQSLFAGVEPLINDPYLPVHLPLARMVDQRMTTAMVETICMHVLNVHRQMPAYARQQREKRWFQLEQTSTTSKTIGLCGYGNLGAAAARMLRAFGFSVMALRRSETGGLAQSAVNEKGIEVVSGEAGFARLVKVSDIVINLMPLTPLTKNYFNLSAFGLMKSGATFINLGRGAHVVEDDLREALKEHLALAILDVFQTEPLPTQHWAWEHDKVVVTPHVAAYTNPAAAAKIAVENIQRLREGKELLYLVDRERGY